MNAANLKDRPIAVGYVDRGGPAGQGATDEEAIRDRCEDRGWTLLDVRFERRGGRAGLERPGLRQCLERIAAGQAQALVVPRLEAISRSLTDLAALLEWFGAMEATLVCLDPELDTGRRAGRLVSQVVGRLAGWQREDVAERTRASLARARAAGRPVSRPAVGDHPALRERIAGMRADGMSLQGIADALNAEAVPTLRGGAKWRPSSVQAAAGYRRPGRRPREPKLPPLPPRGHPGPGRHGPGRRGSQRPPGPPRPRGGRG
jgi:DNA invertase Pin-like site-specific DNA recombinase